MVTPLKTFMGFSVHLMFNLSFTIYLINKYNVDILAVSQRLGHAKPTTTLKYYSQLWRGRNLTVADQLNGAIGKIEHPDHSLVDFNGNQFVAL